MHLAGCLVFTSGVAVLHIRRGKSRDNLNDLGSPKWVMFDLAMKGANVSMALASIIAAVDGVYRLLLIESRVLIGSIAVAFYFALLNPFSKNNDGTHVALLLHWDSLKHDSVGILVYSCILPLSLLDVNLLRLLPWEKTDLTEALQGFPTLFAVRSIRYGALAATLIQLVASVVNVVHWKAVDDGLDQSTSILFVAVSAFNLLVSFFMVALLLQASRLKDLEHFVWAHVDQLIGRTGSGRRTPREGGEQISPSSDILEQAPNVLDNEVPVVEVDQPEDGYLTDDEEAEEEGGFKDKTMEMWKEQMKERGIQPVEYIPLPKLKAELASFYEAINAGKSYNEARFEHLVRCLDWNPEHIEEQAEIARKWREKIQPFCAECLEIQRSFIPAKVSQWSIEELIEKGLSKALAQRIKRKEALILVRMDPARVMKLHVVELLQRLNPLGQNLDIVEMASVLAMFPQTFPNDSDGRKAKLRIEVENSLKAMMQLKQDGKLHKDKLRSPAYSNQLSIFADDKELRLSLTSRSSPRSSSPRSNSYKNIQHNPDDEETKDAEDPPRKSHTGIVLNPMRTVSAGRVFAAGGASGGAVAGGGARRQGSSGGHSPMRPGSGSPRQGIFQQIRNHFSNRQTQYATSTNGEVNFTVSTTSASLAASAAEDADSSSL